MNVLCSWLCQWRLPRNPQMKEVDSFIFVSLRMHVRSCWYGHPPLCAFNFKFASLLSYRPVKWISSRLGRRNLPVPLPHWEWQRPSEPEGGLGGHWAVPCFPTPRDSGSRRARETRGMGRPAGEEPEAEAPISLQVGTACSASLRKSRQLSPPLRRALFQEGGIYKSRRTSTTSHY